MADLIFLISVFGIFILLLLSGLYIHSVLFTIGIFGLVFLKGFPILKGFLGSVPIDSTASYTLSTIPLFVIMAQFIIKADIVKDIFAIVHKLSRGRSALLGILTIISGGFLGAVSGSGTATASALGQAAVPELRKYGYKLDLAGAIAATGGSLSSIIPPSIGLILYGIVTETPIGDLFIGAVFPGIILVFSFCVILYYFYRRENIQDFKKSELTNNTFLKEQNISAYRMTISVVVGLFIIIVIFGGIYFGFMTPTEAGGVGAFASFIAALLLGKVNKMFLKETITETIQVNGMVMAIFIGANIFGKFISLSLLPRKLVNLTDPLLDYPFLILIILAIVFYIMFMFIEAAAVILMAMPVMIPIVENTGYSILWFGVFTAVMATIGMITPPVGLSVYGVSGPTKIPASSVFRYTTFFALIAGLIMTIILIIFPELVLWLPTKMED